MFDEENPGYHEIDSQLRRVEESKWWLQLQINGRSKEPWMFKREYEYSKGSIDVKGKTYECVLTFQKNMNMPKNRCKRKKRWMWIRIIKLL